MIDENRADANQIERELVDAIYRSILDPSAYEDIVGYLEMSIVNRLTDHTPAELYRDPGTAGIYAHIDRAQTIRDVSQLDTTRHLGQFLEAQKCAAMVISTAGHILRANKLASETICIGATDVFSLPMYSLATKRVRAFLKECSRKGAHQVSQEAALCRLEDQSWPCILMLEPMKTAWSDFSDLGTDAPPSGPPILIKSTDIQVDGNIWNVVRAALDLTPAETEVLKLMTEGLSVKEVATRRHRSALTIRSQLKSIFQKSGITNQVNLIKVATTIALLAPRQEVVSKSIGQRVKNRPLVGPGQLDLSTGRSLRYIESGASDGLPVLFLQPTTRPDFTPEVVRHFAESGLRVVSPVRPGSWGVPSAPKWTVEMAADDYAELARSLGLTEGVLAAFRPGSAYAYSLADRHPELFGSIVQIEAGAPLDSMAKIKKMPKWPRTLFWTARRAPPLLFFNFRLGTAEARKGPDQLNKAAKFYFRGSQVDRSYLDDAKFREYFRRTVAYTVHDPDQQVRDIILWAKDWSHTAKRVATTAKLTFFQGSEFSWFAAQDIYDFCKSVPNAQSYIVDGEGQFLFYRRPDVLAECLKYAGGQL